MEHDVGDWYEVVALERGEDDMQVLTHEEHRAYIHGRVGDVVIAKIDVDVNQPEQAQQSIQATKIMLEKAGIETALILPGGVDILKIRRIDNSDRVAQLDRRFHGALKKETTVH